MEMYLHAKDWSMIIHSSSIPNSPRLELTTCTPQPDDTPLWISRDGILLGKERNVLPDTHSSCEVKSAGGFNLLDLGINYYAATNNWYIMQSVSVGMCSLSENIKDTDIDKL